MTEFPRLGSYGAVVCDVDGVLHVGGDPLPGADAWIEAVQAAGLTLLLVTNASWERAVTLARLAAAGISVPGELVVTSGEAVVDELVRMDVWRVAVMGAGSVTEALAGSGIDQVDPAALVAHPRRAALVLGVAADRAEVRRWLPSLVQAGVPVLSTNRDIVYAEADGPEVGTGRRCLAWRFAPAASPSYRWRASLPPASPERGPSSSSAITRMWMCRSPVGSGPIPCWS